MKNIIDAIIEIVEKGHNDLNRESSKGNIVTQKGSSFEEYVKSAFAGVLGMSQDDNRDEKYESTFVYKGNESRPPDCMLYGGDLGDAIEIKQQKDYAQIQFNSSFPKRKFTSDNAKITEKCRNCEKWSERDMLYVIGKCTKTKVKEIYMVYGTEYFDNNIIYKEIEGMVKNSLEENEIIDTKNTNELGRINKIDNLQISSLRIRPMWLVKHPKKMFEDIYKPQKSEFNLMVLINTAKYATLNGVNKLEMMARSINNLTIDDVEVPNPSNLEEKIKCKLITYCL